MIDRIASVAVRVDVGGHLEPGAIAVLLDLLDAAYVRAEWSVPAGTDPELLDRLMFSGHDVVEGDVATLSMSDDDVVASHLRSDPLDWLRDAQVSIGRTLENRGEWVMRIDADALDRSESLSVVADALDLVAGLVRAGRMRVSQPSG